VELSTATPLLVGSWPSLKTFKGFPGRYNLANLAYSLATKKFIALKNEVNVIKIVLG
jgi:hypothetical protein